MLAVGVKPAPKPKCMINPGIESTQMKAGEYGDYMTVVNILTKKPVQGLATECPGSKFTMECKPKVDYMKWDPATGKASATAPKDAKATVVHKCYFTHEFNKKFEKKEFAVTMLKKGELPTKPTPTKCPVPKCDKSANVAPCKLVKSTEEDANKCPKYPCGKKECPATSDCKSATFKFDESATKNKCVTDCHCDGMRTCSSAKFCQGTSRPKEPTKPTGPVCKINGDFNDVEIKAGAKTDAFPMLVTLDASTKKVVPVKDIAKQCPGYKTAMKCTPNKGRRL